jgi:hypothetical protein
MRGGGHVLPAALLPHAVAQLLPLLLLPPERVRALDLAQIESEHADGVTHFLSSRMVRLQPSR